MHSKYMLVHYIIPSFSLELVAWAQEGFSQRPLSTAPALCLGLFLWALPPSTPLAHQSSSRGSVQQ